MPYQLIIHGAAGRMGRRLIALGSQDARFKIVGAFENAEHPSLGEDAGVIAGCGFLGVPLSAYAPTAADVLIDFSLPEAAPLVLDYCNVNRLPLVMATTGLERVHREQLERLSQDLPVLWAPSMSLAVNLVMKLTEIAGRTLKELGADVDVEIMERHHRFKEDAPSGTALKFGQIVASSLGRDMHRHGREGRLGPRPRNEIGYHALRVGDNPGEHTILFGFLGETIELTVKASNRDCYALGALAAAAFLIGKDPGLYSMEDVLGQPNPAV